MIGKPKPPPAPKLAYVCRRSWSRTPLRPARVVMASHGLLRSARGLSGLSPGTTKALVRSKPLKTDRAGAFRITVFRPLLLSGRKSRPRSRSTYSHRKLRISRSLQPVNKSRRTAAPADRLIFVRRLATFGKCLAVDFDASTVHEMPEVSASRMAVPSRSNSSPFKKRSLRVSRYLSIPAPGFVPSATTPARTAKAYILPTTASTRLA